ncbi:hypothetical protein FZEAL_9358 [Fusarium zealandicum]|uniref:Uncharacterized protein n=1 Tax=Fusarium zealandicum TaxID=1053134 RepID=A0A8H4XFK8_9HYPO|nr:hypothetical protein FZEAL_9358 [Fusarium zealandicum]
MKAAILSLLTGGAVAQITLAPNLLNFAKIDRDSPQYSTCSVALDVVEGCISSIGGEEAAATADPEVLLACACCSSSKPIADYFSVCSTYLEDEAPLMSTQYSAYGSIYELCALSGKCGSTPATRTSEKEDESSTITSSPSEQTYAEACEDMISLYNSCSAADKNFAELPNREQALCYCCRGSGDKLSWTDELDGYASTCADWAVTGESETAYPVAKTFATYCQRFSDVCDNAATATEEEESTMTDDASSTEEVGSRQTNDDDDDSQSDSTSDQGSEPVTVTVAEPTATDAQSNDNAAPSLRVGFGAVLAAVAALAVTL